MRFSALAVLSLSTIPITAFAQRTTTNAPAATPTTSAAISAKAGAPW